MDNSKKFLKDHDVVPTISFKESPKHTFVLRADKIDKLTGNDGKPVDGVRFLVEEDGEKKTFFTSSIGLIQKLSQKDVGESVTVEMKSKKGDDGKWKSYFVVGEEKENESTPTIDLDSDKVDLSSEEIPF